MYLDCTILAAGHCAHSDLSFAILMKSAFFTGSALFILQHKIEYVFIKQFEKSAFFLTIILVQLNLKGLKISIWWPQKATEF